jgi:hypothetical protein
MGGDVPATIVRLHVEREDNAITPEAVEPSGDKSRVGERQTPYHDARDAGAEIGIDLVFAANTAAGLHFDPGVRSDALNQFGLGSVAVLGAVEIDHMQPSRASCSKFVGHSKRVLCVGGHLVETTLTEPYAIALAKVNGWINNHAMPRKFFRTSSPTSPDRSGWN